MVVCHRFEGVGGYRTHRNAIHQHVGYLPAIIGGNIHSQVGSVFHTLFSAGAYRTALARAECDDVGSFLEAGFVLGIALAVKTVGILRGYQLPALIPAAELPTFVAHGHQDHFLVHDVFADAFHRPGIFRIDSSCHFEQFRIVDMHAVEQQAEVIRAVEVAESDVQHFTLVAVQRQNDMLEFIGFQGVGINRREESRVAVRTGRHQNLIRFCKVFRIGGLHIERQPCLGMGDGQARRHEPVVRVHRA